MRLLQQLAESDPDAVSPHRYLKFAYIETGDPASYLAEMKKEARLLHDTSLAAVEDAAEKGFAAHGVTGMLEAQLDRQKKSYDEGKLSPFYVADTYSRLGDSAEAMKYLEIACDRHADEAVVMAVDPAFNNLHSLPAFQLLLKKMGLPSVN